MVGLPAKDAGCRLPLGTNTLPRLFVLIGVMKAMFGDKHRKAIDVMLLRNGGPCDLGYGTDMIILSLSLYLSRSPMTVMEAGETVKLLEHKAAADGSQRRQRRGSRTNSKPQETIQLFKSASEV